MSIGLWRPRFSLVILAALTLAPITNTSARGDFLYQLDTNIGNARFNNSQGTETEDNWVANSFQVVAGGETLVSFTFRLGETYSNRAITAAVYRGSSLLNPQAGGGLTLISTTNTTVTGTQGSFVTINLSNPVDLAVGDLFYAALLMPGVPGNQFPWYESTINPQGRSFFDVGPAQGAPYNLNNTQNARVFGDTTHPVVPGGIQFSGNLVLSVNGVSAIPEPASIFLAGMGAVGLVGYAWRKKRSLRLP